MVRVPPPLAVAALLLVAGCVGGPLAPTTASDAPTTGSHQSTEPVSTTPPTTAESTSPPTTADDGYYRAYTVTAWETTLDAAAGAVVRSPAELAERNEDEARIVREAADNGTATRVEMGPDVRLRFDGDPVVVNGTYYRVNATVQWREGVTAHLVHADGPLGNRYDGDELESYAFRAREFSSLPAADRRVVAATIGVADDPYRNFHGIGYWHHFEDGTVPNESVLADGEAHVVRYEDTLWTIRLDPNRTSRQVRYRVDYSLDRVARNESAWHEYVRRNYVEDASEMPLSEDARGVLDDAIDRGRVEWEGTTEDDPEGFRELAATLRSGYVVRDGTIYRVTVQKVVE